MNDFISLNCPSCGGHLKLDSNTREYTCDYCGTNHRVRNEDIEFYGRCPVCKRNDKVEKVTALIHKQDGLARLFHEPEFPSKYNEYHPKPEPKPLPKPNYEEVPRGKWNKYKLIGFSSLVLFVFSVIAVFSFSTINEVFYLFFVIVFIASLISTPIFLFIGFTPDNKASYLLYSEKLENWKKDNSKNREDWEEQERVAYNKFQVAKEYYTKRYVAGLDRYKTIYYCYRDDCIFIPGENDYTSSANFEDFLYKGMN